jgi:hypothetical protein
MDAVVSMQQRPAEDEVGVKVVENVEFTIPEVMEICGVGRRMVMSWMEDGKLPGWHFLYNRPKLGRRIPAKALRTYLEVENPMRLGILDRTAAAKAKEMGLAS